MDRDPDDALRLSEQGCFAVLDALADASVDPHDRLIIWGDGARLSIEDTARRIHAESGMPLETIESHLIGWLEMTYEPHGLTEQQLEEFELLIEQWITPYDEAL
jgi:hypothetical protein